MHVGNAVDGEPVIFRQLCTPEFAVSVKGPVVPVVPAPKNGPAVLIQKLFRDNGAAGAFDIHDAYGVVGIPVDGDGVSPNNIQKEFPVF